MKYINQLDLAGKRVLIRVDFNVPLDEEGNITDDNRIRAALPTINYALDEDAKVIVASHMGRPKGKRDEKFSMAPVARRLGRLLKKEVIAAPDCVGPEVEEMVRSMKPGQVMMLENLRFHKGETDNDPEFGKALASLCDVYVDDAFAVAHRENASVVAVVNFAPESVAGFTMKKELDYFRRAMIDPARPLAAVLGGAKAMTKLPALENLMEHADKILIGGAMANTFLMSVGIDVGKSLYEPELVPVANVLLRNAKAAKVKMYIPVDCVVADRYDRKAETKLVTVQDVPKEWMIMDIGPATSTLYREALRDCKTIIWNGPMGAFEMDAFSRGTYNMVSTVAQTYALTIIGGGDTDVAVSNAGESENISYISTGGGAFLALLTGETLPAVEALGGYTGLENGGHPA
ncbi:MAG: phosphoglycerate kinase [Desulfarculus sp.]|nr:phosphoglycerate kinase [Pseudomonadota bacterium]MBV1714774.1 phosphoglycerate kinase [Desulfarculus sp.]MBU4574859.1 phosphoglycerate kinase [Pseudomonadota bacterium]MBU4600315.1 phosphoglycerate kinase [Pseudomonadota bacterium]MBV1740262.1 phosphoglycerate kinase [Desulfarculus sp.]